MSNASKKRGGIGGFWDAVAPPAETVDADARAAEPAPPQTPSTPPAVADPEQAAGAGKETVRQADRLSPPPVSTPRGRGRPPSSVPKERMTVNLSSRSLQILESLRYQARMNGRRNATFSDLLDEAVELLAKRHKLPLSDEK